MPELPEVETVRRGLEPVMTQRRIIGTVLHRSGLRTPFAPDLPERLTGRTILRLTRRAKYLLIHLDSGDSLVLHLGMSGRISILESVADYTRHKHDHMVFTFDDGRGIAFNDARRFGMAFVVAEKDMPAHSSFRTLGPEPLSKDFTGKTLKASLTGKKPAVKTALMDQRIVAGIGNIYACEALFKSRITPGKCSGDMTVTECEALTDALRIVLQKAIQAGGSSLRDHRQADGTMGYFQHEFAVYGKAGHPCPRHVPNDKKKHIVKKITQGGRSTFYCPDCQKA